ncbi:MAG: peptidoglycan editing factor PgeF [Pseudomonadota bacterium]
MTDPAAPAPNDRSRPTRIEAATLDGVRHGFFTREGGVSTGLYAGLNAGQGSGDDPEAVTENRRRVAATLGAAALVSARQVHGRQVAVIEAPLDRNARPEADAMVTDRPDIALGVLVADCAPVLLADGEAGVVGAAHAGWKGALAGVTDAVIDAMLARGAARERISAAIGPCISQPNYEVGPDLRARFVAEDARAARFFAPGNGDRLQFDLPGYVAARLAAAGVDAVWTGQCTYADPSRFYSYRRATHAGEGDYGRLVAAIAVSR